jgi:hypothetical protein
MTINQQSPTWSPLYFLAALGAGGMIVTFFMYLLFWVPHPGNPIPVYEDWVAAFVQGGQSSQVMIFAALSGVILFTILHISLLVWNLYQYKKWKASGEHAKVQGYNSHTQLLAIPLTLAMTVNAGFITGALFVPGLWSYVEVLFPLAMSAFVMLGIWAMRLYLSFFSHTVSNNSFNKSANNSLAQLMPGFAFAMISVGLAAPAAMSHDKVTVASSIFLSSLFMIPALFVTLVKLVIGIGHMLEHGANKSALPTLWVGVPILTTLSIAVLRIDHGMVHTLHISESSDTPFLFLSMVLVAQIFLILLGGAVMVKMNYFRSLWKGEEKTPVVFAIICPGVAFSTSQFFFINKGLVAAGLIEKFGVTFWTFSGFAIVVQMITGLVLIGLIMQQIIVKKPEPVLLPA